jgi:hypothetical protein
MAKRIKNIAQLQQRINRTKLECRNMEAELDKRLDYLQDNYVGMAANSTIYGFIKSPKSFGIAKDVFTGIWKADNIKEFIKKTALRLLHAVAVRLGFKIVRDFAEGRAGATEPAATNEPPAPKTRKTKQTKE